MNDFDQRSILQHSISKLYFVKSCDLHTATMSRKSCISGIDPVSLTHLPVFLVSCDRSQCEPPTTTSTSTTTTTTTPRPVRIEPEFDDAQLGSRQGPGLSRGDEGIRGDPGRMGRTGDSGVPGRDIKRILTFIFINIYFPVDHLKRNPWNSWKSGPRRTCS